MFTLKTSCLADEIWRQGQELSKSTKSHRNHEAKKKMFNCFQIDDRTMSQIRQEPSRSKKEATKQRKTRCPFLQLTTWSILQDHRFEA